MLGLEQPVPVTVLRRKLNELVTLLVKQAEGDPEFAHELGAVLGVSEAEATSPVETTKRKVLPLNVVELLQANGIEVLRAELERLTDDELRQLARAQGTAKGIKLKSMTREELIESLIHTAERLLAKGSSFLGVNRSEERS